MSLDVYEPEVLAEELDEEDYMPTFEHSVIEANISTELRNFVKDKNLGRVTGSSAEYRFMEQLADKKVGRQPDIAFVRRERLPVRFRSYPDIAPDLVVEIVSPSDKLYETEAKIQAYQQAGVSLIWLVNPFSRTVDVFRLNEGVKSQRFVEGEELDGAEVLPGFKLAIGTIFDYPADPDPVPDPKPLRLQRNY